MIFECYIKEGCEILAGELYERSGVMGDSDGAFPET